MNAPEFGAARLQNSADMYLRRARSSARILSRLCVVSQVFAYGYEFIISVDNPAISGETLYFSRLVAPLGIREYLNVEARTYSSKQLDFRGARLIGRRASGEV